MSEREFLKQVHQDVERALDEDVGPGDLTAELVPATARATATITCRQAAVVCGRPWVEEILHRLAPTARADWRVPDGGTCVPG